MTDDTGTPLASSRADRNGRGLEGFSVGNAIRLPAAGVLAHGLDDGVEAGREDDGKTDEEIAARLTLAKTAALDAAIKKMVSEMYVARGLPADWTPPLQPETTPVNLGRTMPLVDSGLGYYARLRLAGH